MVNQILSVARRVDDLGLLRLAPKRFDVSVSPRAVSSNLVDKKATKTVQNHQNSIVDVLA